MSLKRLIDCLLLRRGCTPSYDVDRDPLVQEMRRYAKKADWERQIMETGLRPIRPQVSWENLIDPPNEDEEA